MSAKKLSPVRRLELAMDRCALARGEANWTNGYRSAASASPALEAQWRLKEQSQWLDVEKAEAAFTRLARRVLREVRASSRTGGQQT